MPRKQSNITERFLGFISPEPNTGCWLWMGIVRNKHRGYGAFTIGARKMVSAHRFSWEHFHGTIPEGLQIDHLCRNTSCVNPDHLEPVTPKENTIRSTVGSTTKLRHAAKTHCPHGHHIDGRTKHGSRFCKICATIRKRAYKQRLSAIRVPVTRRGENIGTSKLTTADVLRIHELSRAGAKRTEIAALFPVNRNTIDRIITGARWPHMLTDPALSKSHT